MKNTNLRLGKALSIMSWPFMPKSSQRIWEFMGCSGTPEDAGLDEVLNPVKAGQELQDPVPVYKKVEIEMPEENNEKAEKKEKQKKQPQPAVPEGPFADFRRLDVRAGTVIDVQDHPDAEKLYVLKVDLGEEEPRQLVTNIKSYFSKEDMLNKPLLVISNLKPANFRGVKSYGMLMAADDEPMGGDHLLLVRPSGPFVNGAKVNSGLENSSSRIDIKHFEKVTIKVAKVVDGKFLGMDIDLPEGAPERIVAVVDGDKVIPFMTEDGVVMTVESDIMDGADVA